MLSFKSLKLDQFLITFNKKFDFLKGNFVVLISKKKLSSRPSNRGLLGHQILANSNFGCQIGEMRSRVFFALFYRFR